MIDDLKIIKKKYGEKMMHFCRKTFPTILEEKGRLSKILLDNFAVSKDLYNDLVTQNALNSFKDLIYKIYLGSDKLEDEEDIDKTPSEIFDELGYDFFACKNIDEILSFKKYYAPNEELCTFSENRLVRSYIFWAVRKDVETIKREDFPKPDRQDKYGTSVMSIQFTKDESHTLSIKNRYNQTVKNPDNTYYNNLDLIYRGLRTAFKKTYGLEQNYKLNSTFELENYCLASDGKYYKYNYAYSNIYYCGNNVIIDNYKVKKYEPEKYIIMDCYILDLVNKTLKLYDDKLYDSFVDTVTDIKDILIKKDGQTKEVTIILGDGSSYLLKLDSNNNIIELYNDTIKKIDDYFLTFNTKLKYIYLPQVTEIGHCFLFNNTDLVGFNLDNVILINNYFLSHNDAITDLSLPSVVEIGNHFLLSNKILKSVNLPNLLLIRDNFLYNNLELETLNLSEVFIIGTNFLHLNNKLKEINLDSVTDIAGGFLSSNQTLEYINLPNLIKRGKLFLQSNKDAIIDAPLVSMMDDEETLNSSLDNENSKSNLTL